MAAKQDTTLDIASLSPGELRRLTTLDIASLSPGELRRLWRGYRLLLDVRESLREALAAKAVENEKLIGLLGEMVEEFWDGDDCKRSGTSNQAPVHPGSLVALEAVRFVRSLSPIRVARARQSWDFVEEDAP